MNLKSLSELEKCLCRLDEIEVPLKVIIFARQIVFRFKIFQIIFMKVQILARNKISHYFFCQKPKLWIWKSCNDRFPKDILLTISPFLLYKNKVYGFYANKIPRGEKYFQLFKIFCNFLSCVFCFLMHWNFWCSPDYDAGDEWVCDMKILYCESPPTQWNHFPNILCILFARNNWIKTFNDTL